MHKDIILLHTANGSSYSRHIKSSINWIKEHKRKDITAHCISVNDINRIKNSFDSANTIIHSRAAHPNCNWIKELVELESKGFKIINNTKTLRMTSDKLDCAHYLISKGLNHPATYSILKRNLNNDGLLPLLKERYTEFIAKPRISQGQGTHVKLFHNDSNTDYIISEVNTIPGDEIIFQEFVDYNSLFRIIVIGGIALPYVFYDIPTEDNWKVSVCLNKNIRIAVESINEELFYLAERTQKSVGGNINFIDIFHTPNGNYYINEINTACNLRIHELKLKHAGIKDWNIHYKIAKYLANL